MQRLATAFHTTIRNIWFVVGVFLLIGVIALLIQIQGNRADSAARNDLLEQIKQQNNNAQESREQLQKLAHRIASCTTPGGKCYDENNARTAEVVGSINQVTTWSIICGEEFDGAQAIMRCIKDNIPSS